jgi:hypothetical protein
MSYCVVKSRLIGVIMEALSTTETSVNYDTTQRSIPEDFHPEGINRSFIKAR